MDEYEILWIFINIIFNKNIYNLWKLMIHQLNSHWIIHIEVVLTEINNIDTTVNLYIINRIGVLWSSLLPLACKCMGYQVVILYRSLNIICLDLIGNQRSSTTQCWPRPACIITRATISNWVRPVANTSVSVRFRSQILAIPIS